MSIIQEALKKLDPPGASERPAERPVPVAPTAPPPARQAPPIPRPADHAAPQRAARPLLSRQAARAPAAPGRPARAVAAVVLCVACAAAIAVIAARSVPAKKPSPAAFPHDTAPVPPPPPHQETIYKTVDAAPAAAASAPVPGPAPVVRSAPPDLRLDGIMYLDSGPRAIINNSIVGAGDMVSGATVSAINKKSVILTYNNVEITLNLT